MKLLTIGHLAGDDRDLRLKKTVASVSTLGVAALSTLLGLINVIRGPASGGLQLFGGALLFSLVGVFALWRRFEPFVIALVLTLLVGEVLASAQTSGSLERFGLITAGLMAPLIAAVLLDATLAWAAAGIYVVGIWVENALLREPGLASEESRISVAVNLTLVTCFAVGVISYQVRKRRQALTELAAEHARSESLLLNILPKEVASLLKARPGTLAERFDDATILFADIVGFTALSAQRTPEELVQLLDSLFSEFDALADKHGLEKIKTIGDAYMVAGGLPVRRSDHVQAVAAMALEMVDVVRAQSKARGIALDVRIGINTGPVVAGVIGKRKFVYDLWGDAVNLASRMESHGLPGAIHVSAATRERLEGHFTLEARGKISVKGKGELDTWFLRGPAGGVDG